MATPKVLLKRSSVAGNAPSASDLDYGELAINFADGKIYYKDNSNAIKAFVDSARVETIAAAVEVVARAQLDSGEVTSLIDTSYVQARVPLSYLSGLIDSSYVQLRAAFDTKFAAKSTSDLSEGSNLYYTKARADSDIASSLNDSGNTVNITINNTITDTVDSAYVLARVNEAPFLDSASALNLIDSAHIQARQTSGGLDSSLTTQFIDSAYIQLRDTPQDFAYGSLTGAPAIPQVGVDYADSAFILASSASGLDSALTTQLIDSAYTQLRVSNQGLRTTDSVTFAGLTVTGTMTTVHSDNLRVKDPLIHLADSQTVGDQFDIGFVGHYSDSANGPSKHTGLVRDASNSQYYLFNELVQDGLDSTDNFIQVGGTGWALANLNAANITSNLTGNVTGTVSSLSNFTSDNLAVGSSNLYFTNTLADARVNAVADSAYIELRRPPESVFVVTHSGSSAYTFNGDGFSASRNNPTLYLTRGKTYKFAIAVSGHPFQIRVSNGGSAYSTGVTNNGAQTGNILFTPDMNAPTSLVYQCTSHSGMVGDIVILDDTDAIGLDSALASQLIDSAYIRLQTRIGDSDIDFGSNKILYSNLYTAEADLPSASTYHGMFAHVHGTGAGYFAHAGNWIRLANKTETLDSALTAQLIDSAYIQLRQSAGGGSGTVDSAYVEANSLDSQRTLLLIDSAYIQDRQAGGGGGTVDSAYVESVSLDSERTQLLIDSAYIQLRQTSGGGGTDSALTIQLIDSAHVQARQSITQASPLLLTNLIYTADSGQVSFTGADDNGATLAVDSGKLQVFLNGILLSNADFSHNATKVDLTIAADSADILTVVKIGGNSGTSGFQQKHFIYNADSGQTIFTGAAAAGGVLSYSNFDRTNVYLNGIMLISGTDYTATNGSTVTLIDAADSGDVLDVNTFIGSNIGLDSADVTNIIDSAYVTARAGAGTDSATVLNLIDSAHVQLHAVGLSYTRLTNTPTIPGLSTHFVDSAEVIKLITANAIDSSVALTLLLDSIETIALIDSAYVAARAGAGTDSAAVINLIDSAYVQARGTGAAPFELTNFIYTADSGQVTFTGADTNSRTLAIDSGKLQVFLNGILLSDADFSHNAAKVDLTIAADSADILTVVKMDGNNSASNFQSKHFIYNADSGQTAFTGAATSGEVLRYSNADRTNVYLNGIMLINGTDFTATSGSTLTLIDGADSGDVLDINVFRGSNISLDSASAINLIDSAYVTARAGAGTDSATVLNLIDSAHVRLQTRIGDSDIDFGAHTIKYANVYTAEADLPSASTYHGMFAHVHNTGGGYFAHAGNWIKLANKTETLDSALTTQLIDSAYVQLRQVTSPIGLVENIFAFTTATPATSITGTDDKGATLDVSVGYADVFLNGILLRDSDDYTINGTGTTLTLVSATDSADLVTVKNSKGVIVTPQVKKFEYTTAAPATTISGNDLSGKALAYVPGSLQVHLNGILLQEASDFTASTGNSIVLTTATDSADDISISAFSAPGSKLELYKFTADSGQTVFSGNDNASKNLSYEPGNIQVFKNGLLLNDSDDYSASNSKAVTLLTAAAINDELQVASFETTSEITRSNTWTAPSGTVSAAAGDKLFIDTSGGARTVTLPSSATMGDEIRIIDVTGNAGTNNITVSRNGHNIQGAASDLVINIARAGTGLAYYNSTQGWVLIEN